MLQTQVFRKATPPQPNRVTFHYYITYIHTPFQAYNLNPPFTNHSLNPNSQSAKLLVVDFIRSSSHKSSLQPVCLFVTDEASTESLLYSYIFISSSIIRPSSPTQHLPIPLHHLQLYPQKKQSYQPPRT